MRVVTFAILFAFAGCQFDPFTSLYTRGQPKAEDLVGVYVPDERTAQFIALSLCITFRTVGTLCLARLKAGSTRGKADGSFRSMRSAGCSGSKFQLKGSPHETTLRSD
jgi:hypothetical protein